MGAFEELRGNSYLIYKRNVCYKVYKFLKVYSNFSYGNLILESVDNVYRFFDRLKKDMSCCLLHGDNS
jgi:hypothetical protein